MNQTLSPCQPLPENHHPPLSIGIGIVGVLSFFAEPCLESQQSAELSGTSHLPSLGMHVGLSELHYI
jgi:hypothetical protein